MPVSAGQAAWAAVIAVITLMLIAAHRRWLVARHRTALANGRQFSFEAFLRGNVLPYPLRFRLGWVTVGHGLPTWKPRSVVPHRRIDLPASAVVERVRPLTFWENVTLNEDCRVVVARAGGLVIELAVLIPEVTTVLSALAAGTGGGWRTSVAKIGAHDVSDKERE